MLGGIKISFKNIDTILFDLNGTLYEKGIALDGVNETIEQFRHRKYNLSFITNTDGRSEIDVYQRVLKKGIDIRKEELYTPVTAVKQYIKQNNNKTFYPLVHDDVINDLQNLKYDDIKPDYIIIGDFCDKLSYKEINKVFRMIKNGAQIVALSKTLWYIDAEGYNINTGSFVKMFEIACDKEAILMGKPAKMFFEMALKRTDSKPENTLIVGDDIKTDIMGAKRLKAKSVLVRTGVFEEKVLKRIGFKPDFIIDNINELIKLFMSFEDIDKF